MGSHRVGHDCSDLAAAAAAEKTYRTLRTVCKQWSWSCHCHHYHWSIRLMDDSTPNPGTWLLTQRWTPLLPGLKTRTRTAPVEPRARWGRGGSQLHTLALTVQFFNPWPCVPDQCKGPWFSSIILFVFVLTQDPSFIIIICLPSAGFLGSIRNSTQIWLYALLVLASHRKWRYFIFWWFVCIFPKKKSLDIHSWIQSSTNMH